MVMRCMCVHREIYIVLIKHPQYIFLNGSLLFREHLLFYGKIWIAIESRRQAVIELAILMPAPFLVRCGKAPAKLNSNAV